MSPNKAETDVYVFYPTLIIYHNHFAASGLLSLIKVWTTQNSVYVHNVTLYENAIRNTYGSQLSGYSIIQL